QSKHVGHRIEPGLLPARPGGGGERTAGENHAVLGAMHQLHPLGRAGEDYLVLADHAAAAQACEADVALPPCPGLAVAAARRVLRQIDAAPLRRRTAEHQRRARWCIDLALVVHLEDLDVE